MKLKEAKVCCAFSWSPASIPSGTLIASGSVAGAMDDDFNSEAYLEIRKVVVTDTSSREMPVIGRTLMTDRVFRIDWSAHGGPNGIIAGCFTDGSVHVWSVDTILENYQKDPTKDTEDPLLCRIQAHTGPCRTLQFSPTQPHFLATGGQDKELCIWTLQDPREPAVVPALPKATHPGEVTDVKWNPKFAHILATATSNGTVIVWDLKARRTALTFNVSANQPGAASCLAWHPEVSTHIAVGRDEVNPVVQLWDLKKAVAPIKELRGHSKGVTGLSWNSEDASLLLSCGCDGRTLCWNPVSGDLLGELPPQDNWIYEVRWCPSVTAVVATSSFDSSLGVYSAQEISAGGSGATRTVPKWLRRPCGAVFGFGGLIAIPVKGTNQIRLASTTKGTVQAGDHQFRQSLMANPPNTAQRLELLRDLGHDLLAATAACNLVSNRAPLLEHLGVIVRDIDTSVDNLEVPYCMEEEEFESLLSKCVVGGRIHTGVKLCLAAGRLDDAFAVAQLSSKPSDVTLDVVKKYCTSGKLRFVQYIKAILLDAFEELLDNSTVELPWMEVLALLATYLPAERFSALAEVYGNKLKDRQDGRGAATAFVCSANVDAVAQMYTESNMAAQSLVQYIMLLEQTVGKQCTAPIFAQSLSSYAATLANSGDFEGALLLSNRAAQLGDAAAAVVADRIQYHVPVAAAVKVSFPFVVARLPDATSIECHMLASKQTAQVAAAPSAPVAAPSAAVAHKQPVTSSPVTQGYGQLPTAPTTYHQQHHQQSTVPAAGAATPHYAQPIHHSPQHNHHQQQHAPVQPTHQPTYSAPVQHSAPVAPPAFAAPVPPPVSNYQPTSASSPPMMMSTPPIATAPPSIHRDPVIAAPPTPAVSSTVGAPPTMPNRVAPVTTTPPVATASTIPASRAAPATTAALPPSSIAAFDVSTLANPTHQSIARGIIDATAKVTDKRKRDAIEKSANELFDRLSKGAITDVVAEPLLTFVNSIGTPNAKELWRKLSDAHFDVVQPFINIKFL